MCFSAEADIATGILVTAIGVDALKHVSTREQLPLATLPLVFGAHQLVEAFVWWGLDGKVSSDISDAATLTYLAIAFVLPLWVPLAVRAVEPSPVRRNLMALFAVVGALAGAVLLSAALEGPVGATNGGRYIAYSVAISQPEIIGTLYVVAACCAPLVSSDRWIRNFAVVNIGAVAVLAWVAMEGLTSLWCGWAAITSLAINLYLRSAEASPETLP